MTTPPIYRPRPVLGVPPAQLRERSLARTAPAEPQPSASTLCLAISPSAGRRPDVGRLRETRTHLPRNANLVPLLAALTAWELNTAALARDLAIDDETVSSYLPLLEAVFLLHRLPAWSRNLTARVKRRPKMHLTDTGLAAWLLEQSADALAGPGNRHRRRLNSSLIQRPMITFCAVNSTPPTSCPLGTSVTSSSRHASTKRGR